LFWKTSSFSYSLQGPVCSDSDFSSHFIRPHTSLCTPYSNHTEGLAVVVVVSCWETLLMLFPLPELKYSLLGLEPTLSQLSALFSHYYTQCLSQWAWIIDYHDVLYFLYYSTYHTVLGFLLRCLNLPYTVNSLRAGLCLSYSLATPDTHYVTTKELRVDE
jgi:hypothetical protein